MSKGTLYVCATPIGNLEDVSQRLLRILSEVHVVAAEDTRRTRKLLSAHGIAARMVSYHQAKETEATYRLLAVLQEGHDVALVSDGGTPLISDPGYPLVRACIQEGIGVQVVPGPSAAIAALVLSGLPSDRFVFEGFLPRKQGEMRARLKALSDDERTCIFFESPRRTMKTLSAMREELGDRPAALVREITKIHQEVIRGTFGEIIEQIGEREILGEVVVVVGGATTGGSVEAAVSRAMELVAEGVQRSRAAAEAAREHGVPKAEVYQQLVGTNQP